MLLTVTERLAFDRHTANHSITLVTHGTKLRRHKHEVSICSGIGFKCNTFRLCHELLLGLWIKQVHLHLCRKRFVGGVDNTVAKHGLVAHSHEARHVRHNHHALLRHGCSLDKGVVHILIVSITKQTPCGHTLRKRELQVHIALTVCL